MNRNLFWKFAALPVGLSPWQPATTPRTHHCAPVAAHLCLEQDVTRSTMPGISVVDRPVIFIRCYRRWKWHIHPQWPPPLSLWTPTIDRIHGWSCGCTLRALVIYSDRLGGVGDPSLQPKALLTHPPASRLHKGNKDGEHDLLLRVFQPQAPQKCPLQAGVVPPGVGSEQGGDGMQPAAHQRQGKRRR